MLRRIRFELVDRVLRFPPSVFKRVKAAEVATMVKDEVEPLGGFIGDAFVQPALARRPGDHRAAVHPGAEFLARR